MTLSRITTTATLTRVAASRHAVVVLDEHAGDARLEHGLTTAQRTDPAVLVLLDSDGAAAYLQKHGDRAAAVAAWRHDVQKALAA